MNQDKLKSGWFYKKSNMLRELNTHIKSHYSAPTSKGKRELGPGDWPVSYLTKTAELSVDLPLPPYPELLAQSLDDYTSDW